MCTLFGENLTNDFDNQVQNLDKECFKKVDTFIYVINNINRGKI